MCYICCSIDAVDPRRSNHIDRGLLGKYQKDRHVSPCLLVDLLD